MSILMQECFIAVQWVPEKRKSASRLFGYRRAC